MTSRDFCYWLQGHFEIGDSAQTRTLSPAQIVTIQKHLSMVFQAQFNAASQVEPTMGINFCHWLNGMLDTISGKECCLSAELTEMVRAKLFNLFEHVIPSPDTSGTRQDAGRGSSANRDRKPGTGGLQAMC